MATTYATLAEFKGRINITASTYDAKLQSILDGAASTVDGLTRGFRPGYEAFTASASETRYYDDNLAARGMIVLDDCLTVTAVTQGGTAIDAASYQLSPYNPGSGPYTRLELAGSWSDQSNLATSLNTWYGWPYPGRGARQIAVTGTWGYCTQANRPAAIKEAVLLIATRVYEQSNLSADTLAAILSAGGNPAFGIDPFIKHLLGPFKRVEGMVV